PAQIQQTIDPQPLPGTEKPKLETARGIVFEDTNGNGQYEHGEPGIGGIKVSNGEDIVKTDDQGRYSLQVTDDTIVFVIKPRGYMTPVNAEKLPQFYYIHKPAGSPENFRFAGVAPTGPLPESINFPLTKRDEPDKFRALIFGDTQPRNVAEVEYMAHDIIAQVIDNNAHDASFGVTLGDIVFDDLDVMKPHNQAIAMIGIPWYNVIGNHDINYDAEDDQHSDETFERIYGPNYYSFDHGPTHFMVLDDVTWVGGKDGQKGRYFGGLGERQMKFIKNDLAMIPKDQLVVLMMHIPLIGVEDRQELYRLIEQRPATVSLSAHTHYMEHRFIGEEDGWKGPEKHHHVINVTVCGSWWRGRKDERGIPHATMSDGGPNGYSIMEFDGAKYSLEFRAAGRPAEYQMNIYAPESVKPSDLEATNVLVNVFAGSDKTRVDMRVGEKSEWVQMEQKAMNDPAYERELLEELKWEKRNWTELPKPHATPHIWSGKMPSELSQGTHLIEVRATETDGKSVINRRVIRIED
ncbi:MAG TPA: metallophosphoesterase, partial [Planctomycetaceae bacterium]|nr:metallophosphoesterase [Planctomycetaceae bacterium]